MRERRSRITQEVLHPGYRPTPVDEEGAHEGRPY
jgi:hypothetical protein